LALLERQILYNDGPVLANDDIGFVSFHGPSFRLLPARSSVRSVGFYGGDKAFVV
jgi:hypothetical protein